MSLFNPQKKKEKRLILFTYHEMKAQGVYGTEQNHSAINARTRDSTMPFELRAVFSVDQLPQSCPHWGRG